MPMIIFKVGDEVIVNENARGQYMITIPGSKGIISNITTTNSFTKVLITFNYIQNAYVGPHSFPFSLDEVVRNFDLLNEHIPLSKADKKYEKIILKMRSLQNKRKAKGYAY